MTLPIRHDDTNLPRRKKPNSRIAPAVSKKGSSLTDAVVACNQTAAAAAALSLQSLSADEAVLADAVRSAVGEQNYQHWFSRSCRLQCRQDRLIVSVPNPFILNWMLKRFRTELTLAAQRLLGPAAACQFEVDATLVENPVSNSAAEPVSRAAKSNSSQIGRAHV